ncbi:hypothetical protein [Thiorhodococcus minor]|uniref:hypothetical protein n=1 Tax=Thiorhodococcus minor TaxID=57489 RepID=UPI003CC920FB
MLQTEFNFRALMVKEENGRYRMATGEEIIEAAMREMDRRMARGAPLISPEAARDFLKVKLGHRECEVFCALWLETATASLPSSSCSGGPSTGPASTRARWSSPSSTSTPPPASWPTTTPRASPSPPSPTWLGRANRAESLAKEIDLFQWLAISDQCFSELYQELAARKRDGAR